MGDWPNRLAPQQEHFTKLGNKQAQLIFTNLTIIKYISSFDFSEGYCQQCQPQAVWGPIVFCKTCSVLCVLKQPRVDNSSVVPNALGAIGPISLRLARIVSINGFILLLKIKGQCDVKHIMYVVKYKYKCTMTSVSI